MSSRLPPKLKPLASQLRQKILAMPAPGILEITEEPWQPSGVWIRKVLCGELSVRHGRKGRRFVFRLP